MTVMAAKMTAKHHVTQWNNILSNTRALELVEHEACAWESKQVSMEYARASFVFDQLIPKQ